MIKKIMSSTLALILSTSWAGAWGLHRDFVFRPYYRSSDYRVQEYNPYIKSPLYYILQQGKSNFTVCVETYGMDSSDPHLTKPEDIQFKLLADTFPAWVSQTRSRIQQSDRSHEFEDLLSWLPEQLTVTRVSCDQNPDISLNIMRTSHVAGSAMWYHGQQRLWKMNLAYGYSGRSVGLHESGHFFGLGDLTEKQDENRWSANARNNTSDKNYSLYSVGVTHQPKDSVMWWNNDESNLQNLSCDDIEGFINAVDFLQFMSGVTSPRLENGWKSICGRPYYYLRGRVAQDETQLATLKQETEARRLDGNVLIELQQLRAQWLAYQDNQVLPLLSQKRKELKAQTRPLNDQGLMLSAQVSHLQNVFSCVQDAIDIINDTGNNNSVARTDKTVQEVQQQIRELPCQLGLDPMQTPGLQQATPLREDYPVGKTHLCAICGKQISLREEQYASARFKQNQKWISRNYFRHKTCSGITPQQALTYKDNIQEIVAPTYAELLVRSYLANSGITSQGNFPQTLPSLQPMQGVGLQTRSQTPLQGQIPNLPVSNLPQTQGTRVTPVIQPSSQTVVQALPSTPTVKAVVTPTLPTSPATPKPVVQVANPALQNEDIGMVQPGEKIHCEICGKEIGPGETYYKRTETHFIHRHNQCAYTFFARKHKVDENALSSYESYYWIEPKEVFAAKAAMKALDLSVNDIRKYRSQIAREQQQIQQRDAQLAAQKKEIRTKLDQECRVYAVVTMQDIENFEQTHAKALAKIAQKTAVGKELSKKEKLLLQQQEKLKKDHEKTQYCQSLEREAAQ